MKAHDKVQVALFVPCYIDQFYPDVAWATLRLLERCGLEVVYPEGQTCCGQPLANAGCAHEARPIVERWLRLFSPYPYVVCPSGSCTAMVRHHFCDLVHHRADIEALTKRTFELCEFLVDVLNIRNLQGHFPYTVGLHSSCHGLRELRLARSSERQEAPFDKVRLLLEGLQGIRFSQLQRPDECCGFGGTFSVTEQAVSCQMGLDRLDDHRRAGSQIITATDVSCLMHLEGLARRYGYAFRFLHVAQLLDEARAQPSPAASSSVKVFP